MSQYDIHISIESTQDTMVSWSNVLLTVTAAGFLLGRKELPKIARVVGVYSGRSVGAVLRAKQEFFDATKDSDLVKVLAAT